MPSRLFGAEGGMQGNDAMGEVRGKILEKGKEASDPNAQQTGSANYRPYPKPLAKYEEVVADGKLFRETLEKLHIMMGTKFMIPIIGGRDLDLHRLFTEVTSRGGLEKVIADRKWRDVTAAFSFPSTATNASFVLRKYYMSLLHHYEQIYFFGSQGWSSPAPSNTTPLNLFPSDRLIEAVTPYSEHATLRKRRRNNGQSSTTNPKVVGVIDGKFEHGYFVTVTVGSAKLKGVLYHIPENATVQVPQFSGIADDTNRRTTRRRRRRKKLSKRDPAHPKPNRSGYNFFFAEQHARLKPAYPGRDREISKMIGELWNKLTETEKAVYQERGLQDKERYQSEMAVYKERQKLGQVISNAVPIQQLPGEQAMIYANPIRRIVDVDLALTNEHDSSSGDDEDDEDDGDSEDKISHGDSEVETSPGLGGNGTQSNSLTGQFTKEGSVVIQPASAQFENDHTVSAINERVEPKEVVASPTDKQE